MPLDKNQYERRQIIHAQLNTLFHYSWQQLAEQCARVMGEEMRPCMRTIRKDIAMMREDGAPIPTRAPKYHYTRHHTLYGEHRPDEIALMRDALNVLRQIDGLDMFEEITALQLKLAHRLQPQDGTDLPYKAVQFETNPSYEGRTHLSPLYRAIADRLPLHIRYMDFSGQAYEFTIHPYLLKEYQNRWYIFGRFHYEPEILLNLALDRIRAIQTIELPFHPNDRWDFSTYFEPVIGVTRLDTPELQQPEAITLRLFGTTADYVLTKPLHHSQNLGEEADEWVEVRLNVVVNRELINKIMELGAGCEVLAPASLRQQLTEQVRTLAQRYLV